LKTNYQLTEAEAPFSRVSEEPVVENSKSIRNNNSIDWQSEKEYPLILKWDFYPQNRPSKLII